MNVKSNILLVSDEVYIIDRIRDITGNHLSDKYVLIVLDSVDSAINFISYHHNNISLIITELYFGLPVKLEGDRFVKEIDNKFPIIVISFAGESSEQMIMLLRQQGYEIQGFLSHISPLLVIDTIERAIESFNNRDMQSITIEFKSTIWGQLFPIEHALSLILDENYIVEKSKDLIIVRFESPEQLQQGLDAIIPVLASLENVSSGELNSLTISPKVGIDRRIESDELKLMLTYICQRFDTEFPSDRNDLSLAEETLIEGIKLLPGGSVLEPALKRWFTAELPVNNVSFRIYETFMKFFYSAKDVLRLKKSKERDLISMSSDGNVSHKKTMR